MRMTLEVRAAVGVLVCGMFAVGCSQTPTAPSQSAAMASTTGGAQALGLDQAPGLSLEHLAARGWDCRPAPFNPTRVTCSPPNQPHPVSLPGPPPPDDRPTTFTLLVFDNGVFVGTSLLIRSDLYSDQPCRSRGGLYSFIRLIGYYVCLHPKGY